MVPCSLPGWGTAWEPLRPPRLLPAVSLRGRRCSRTPQGPQAGRMPRDPRGVRLVRTFPAALQQVAEADGGGAQQLIPQGMAAPHLQIQVALSRDVPAETREGGHHRGLVRAPRSGSGQCQACQSPGGQGWLSLAASLSGEQRSPASEQPLPMARWGTRGQPWHQPHARGSRRLTGRGSRSTAAQSSPSASPSSWSRWAARRPPPPRSSSSVTGGCAPWASRTRLGRGDGQRVRQPQRRPHARTPRPRQLGVPRLTAESNRFWERGSEQRFS